jgi:signal transduction histidine kinase
MAGWQIAAALACAAPGVVVGLLLAVRRQRVVGCLLVALGALPLLILTPDTQPAHGASAGLSGLDLFAAVLAVAGWVWFYLPPALLVAYFPDGRLPSRRWRWLLVGWAAFLVTFHLAVAVDPESYGGRPDQIPGSAPVDWPAWVTQTLGVGSLGLLLTLLLGSAVSVVQRYRRGSTTVRRQLKWFALSGLLLPMVLLAAWVTYFFTDVSSVVVVGGLLLVYVSIPVTVLIAVLRDDLYDIDRLLSRTVSYVALTASLAALFAVVTVGLGLVLGRGSDAAVAVATLACAVTFASVRTRLQHAVDSRFDRDHRDALARVSQFVDSVRRGSAGPEDIEATLRAALRDPNLRITYAITSDPDEPWRDGRGQPVVRPTGQFLDVAVNGRLLGSVTFDTAGCRPQLLRDVLRQATLPLELARSRIEIRQALAQTEASRARLVQAGDEERRRLERDIHDGAQQHLVAIGMSLRLVQQRLDPSDPTHAALGQAVGELQGALAELRRIAGGVRPTGLDEGLTTALRHLLRGTPVPVQVNVTASDLPESVATTAYYVTAEAVTNALKHADARSIQVDVDRQDGVLRVSVVDDGRGGAAVRSGSGLAGLRDRVLASGGELLVTSETGRGTTVEARLTCES